MQWITSLVMGSVIYFGYKTFLSGMNPYLMPVWGLIILSLLVVNILLIKKAINKLYASLIFLAVGLILPLIYIGLLINALDRPIQSRHYSQDNTPKNPAEKFAFVDPVSMANSPERAAGIDQKQTKDCIRGQAEPVIQKEDYPNTTFVLQPDSISAIETVVFNNGDRLIIRNWGCEYYVLTFRFETSKFQQDTANLEYWFKAARQLMTGMLSGLNMTIDFKRGIMFLGNYIEKDKENDYKNLKLGDEIDFDGNEIRNFVRVDRIEKMTGEKYAVTLSFVLGPL